MKWGSYMYPGKNSVFLSIINLSQKVHLKLSFFFLKKVNTYVRKILANTFIRNFSPYPEAVMESVSIRKALEKF